MNKLILTVSALFIILTIFFIIPSSTLAISWPPEVKPEQGKAWNKREVHDTYNGRVLGESYREITFWNVGQVSGNSDYAKVILTADCSKSTTPGCIAGDPIEGIFSGGPNGVITISGYEFKLHDGKYFELNSGGVTTKYTVENPEIFSKYRWSMDESVPIPKIKGGKYEVEVIGSARFNDLSGQVEVNIPNEDGTYDEEAWNFAKIDMELPPGTRLKVGEKSGILLTFPDTQTNITVGPDTEIILVSTNPQKSVIQLLMGNLKANVKKMMKDGTMEIEMSQAVAGIKGTKFVLNETGTESAIMVTEGVVKFTSKNTGKSVNVSKGESVTASLKGLSEKTAFDPIEEEKQWWEFLANKNIVYLVGGIIIVVVFILGFLLLKTKKT